MRFDQEIVEIRARIAKATSDREHWRRTTGRQDKYLEAYFLVNALERELSGLKQQGSPPVERRKPSPSRLPSAGMPPQLPGAKAGILAPTDKGERERLMSEFSITYFAQQYRYAHYRYDRFEDALSYAKRQLAAPSDSDADDATPPARIAEAPDELQLRRMARHRITFQDGVYHLGPYSYDRLADAIRYARLGRVGSGGSIRHPIPRASPS